MPIPQPSRFIYHPRWTEEDYRRRPQDYDPELAAKIIAKIENGETVTGICMTDRDYPLPGTFIRWTEEEPALGLRFAIALKRRAILVFDSALDEGLSGRPDAATRMRAAQFHAERSAPEKYGPKAVTILTPMGQQDPHEPPADHIGELRRKIDAMADRARANLERQRDDA